MDALREDETATVNGLPRAAQARRTAAPRPALPSTQIAREALRDEETGASLTMIRVARLLGGGVLVALPFIGGSPSLRAAMAASIVVATAISVWVEIQLRRRRVREATTAALAVAIAPVMVVAAMYFGVYSAVQLFPALAINFFARREGRRPAFALYVSNAIAQGAFATLIFTGAIDDPGLIKSMQPLASAITGHLLLQLAFLGSFLIGRGTYKASRDAFDHMRSAMQAAAQKEALLHEARQDLDRALAIDAPGRFTDHVFGGYRLGKVIGRGGMGDVYEARHEPSGANAAVKLLTHRELGNVQSVERFLREVRMARGLSSKHVVHVLAASDERDAIPFLVMERLRGHDLAHHLREGTIPETALDAMLAQIGAALEEAWQQGIVHRDLKPHNIYLCEDQTWKVLDFGVAALEDHSGTLTQGMIVGTPAYMAPEQAKGERVDYRADLYALAAIAYRWLTGRPVCTGHDLHAALYQTVYVMPERPSAVARELHADVDAALAIGLAKGPAQRWTSVGELRSALAAALRGELEPALRTRAALLVDQLPWSAGPN